MRKRIVYTRFKDGGVTINCPSARVVAVMSCGGRWPNARRGWLDEQIERAIADGRDPDASARFVRALAFGGLTTAEALAVIRDRDCAHKGAGCELWDIDDIPADRTYRSAWRRSHNGGPIRLDEAIARAIDERRMWQAYEAAKAAR